MKNSVKKNELKEFTLEDNEQLILDINNAKIEWECAKAYFECENKDRLIDYAIFKERATREKYLYLLREAKRKGIRNTNMFVFK